MMRKTPLFFILLFFFFSILAIAQSPVTASFTMIRQNNYTFDARITLTNHQSKEIPHWTLGFNFGRQIVSIKNATIKNNIGDYYLIMGTKAIPSNNSVSIPFSANWMIKKYSDAPSGLFMIETDANKNAIKKPYSVDLNQINFPNTSPEDFKMLAREIFQENAGYKNRWLKNHSESDKTFSLPDITIVPRPVKMEYTEKNPNEVFVLNEKTSVFKDYSDHSMIQPADDLQKIIFPATGFQLTIKNEKKSKAHSILLTTNGLTEKQKEELGKEGYILTVNPDDVIIRANTNAGLFYGVETFRQLFSPELFSSLPIQNRQWKIPCVTIIDYPRFSYRGIMIDVARNFRTADEIKRFLDLMAMHKLNVFHWHLTDDEGWRIQIKRYPALTDIGAWRGYDETLKPSLGSGYKRYGGFYTQKEIKDVVAYAAQKNIEIIPEIDVPGHARALIESLPKQLKDPLDKSTYTTAQYYHDNVLPVCVCKDEPGCPNKNIDTYSVLNNIFEEVAELFPSEYIHIGFDEVPKGAWEKSPNCQFLSKHKKINQQEWQNYFLNRVQSILKTHHKKIAGWDEMSHFDADKKTSLIYAWQNEEAAINAVKKGFNVIMTPANRLYLYLAYNEDPREPGGYWAGYVNTFTVYDMNITIKNILGIEGGLWSEYINSETALDYMAFPKTAALSELAWTPEKKRNWSDFEKRVNDGYLQRLSYKGVKYRVPRDGVL